MPAPDAAVGPCAAGRLRSGVDGCLSVIRPLARHRQARREECAGSSPGVHALHGEGHQAGAVALFRSPLITLYAAGCTNSYASSILVTEIEADAARRCRGVCRPAPVTGTSGRCATGRMLTLDVEGLPLLALAPSESLGLGSHGRLTIGSRAYPRRTFQRVDSYGIGRRSSSGPALAPILAAGW